MKLDYLYGSRGEDFRFYQLPALLLEAEKYKSLSAQAKILYSVLLSKVSLSRKNGWIEGGYRQDIHYLPSGRNDAAFRLQQADGRESPA